jgi:hypothetical protein
MSHDLIGAMARKIATSLAFWIAIAGLSLALIAPASCLVVVACAVNAGSQLGVGIAGVISGGLTVFLWQYRRSRRVS